jgi:hypothetical protein
MANTYTLLETITVGAATASSVTFNSIPQTGYTDLVIKASVRTNRAGTGADGLNLTFNGSAVAVYSDRALRGNGTAATSFTDTSAAAMYGTRATSAGVTASTFSNTEFYIPNYTSSNYKSVSIDGVSENNATEAYAELVAGLWSNTAAITSVTIAGSVGTIQQYSTFSLYGVSALGTTPTKAPKATGGSIIQTDGTYWYHAFLSSGTFTPATALSCDVLVVAGGGAGGVGGIAGGGGAGGVFYATSQSIGTSAQTVTIGAGGAGSSSQTLAVNGSNSVFGSLTAAVGGGGGGMADAPTANQTSGSGGSSGGIRNVVRTGVSIGTATSGQGNVGAAGSSNTDAGGGGGAGTAGVAGTGGTTSGAGGAGLNTWSSWLSTTGLGVSGFIGGGGGGGGFTPSPAVSAGAGGSGGGGAGGTGNGTSGTANTGGGGGGAGGYSTSGSGGSGLVIIRYLA